MRTKFPQKAVDLSSITVPQDDTFFVICSDEDFAKILKDCINGSGGGLTGITGDHFIPLLQKVVVVCLQIANGLVLGCALTSLRTKA